MIVTLLNFVQDVNICDEYCDPFDMLKINNGSLVQQSADGYREPYNLEQSTGDWVLWLQNN